ncbi:MULTISPECIES: hydrogenase large subunit [unclassified Butyrivibrio]|uniref:hydrogenase large subunit n=1 Tax=unclassified Butyrivibrio TaxID=2639466 RepID=UPI00040864AA|nr:MULTISPECIES: nickel-dependent hydrogenase large subunit [unclassified Butyrivibrio]
MSTRSVIPFGPQHPVLPEPIHLDLVLEDEKVVQAIPSIGFIHRGLEKLVDKKDFHEMVYVAERICGICSLGHGLGYCDAVEHIMDLEVPDRAKYLRTMLSELSRMHSHMLWLGLLADAFGFESLYMECWRIREEILDMFEIATGGRVIFSIMKIGGLRRDIPDDMLRDFRQRLDSIKEGLDIVAKPFIDDVAVKNRLVDVGILTPEKADLLGTAGPFLRASGIARDIRSTGYCAYGDIDFEPIISTGCDSYARTEVRIKEIYQAIDIMRQCIDKMPAGPVDIPVKPNQFPNGEYMARIEQPRGEALYYVKANGSKFIDRMRVRTPTFANIPALVDVLAGCDLADVPILVLTIDPCISCTER